MGSVRELVNAVATALRSVGHGIGWLLSTLSGQFEWFAPGWVLAIGNWVRRNALALTALLRHQPRASSVVAGLVVVLIGGSYAAWNWYVNRPKPVEISFEIEAPGITCYDCDPVGDPLPMRVRFSDSVAPLEAVGKDVVPAKAGFELSPAFAGKWTWDDDRTLSFQPAQDWPIDARFTIDFARHGFVAPHVRLKEYATEFSTPPFAAEVGQTEFYQHPVVATDKKVVIGVKFSHPVDPPEFERRVKLRMWNRLTDSKEEDAGEVAFTVVYDKSRLHAFVHSAQLTVPPKEGRLAATVEPGVRAARGGNATSTPLSATVIVPGLNSLRVNSVELQVVKDEHDDPQQALLLNLSFSALEKEVPPKVHAWLLPTRHPVARYQADFDKSHPNGGAFEWRDKLVTPEALKAAEPVTLAQIPGELEHYELHSFRYRADPGRYVYVRVDRGLKSFGGYLLGDPVEQVLQVPQFPKELRITHSGSLLALSGERKLDVMSRDVEAMRVEIGRLLPHQLQHLVSQTGGAFSQPEFNNWSFDAANITERFTKVIKLARGEPGSAHYEPVDLSKFLAADESDRRGIFLLKVEAWDVQHNRPLGVACDDCGGGLSDTRLVVITDLGLVAKRNLDGSQDLFVQSIHTGDPVGGVTLDIVGKNGEPVLSQITDDQGHAHFGELKSFQHEKAPVLYFAHRGGDASFLPIGFRVRELDLSRFDVGGVDNAVDKNALTAYLFSDRGLYRPGEEIRVASIVRSQDWTRSLKNVPLLLEITDPRGTVVRREKISLGAAGFNEIRHATQDASPSGTWTVSLSVIRSEERRDLIGSLAVQVRDFQPDRLKMSAHFSAESAEGWVSPEKLAARIELQNLFGTPAEKRRVTAEMTLSPALPSFARWRDWQFSDPQLAKEGFHESLADTATDEHGVATLDLNLQRFARATYRVHLVAQGFEADGGRGVAAEAAQLVSNMPFLVGFKADGDLGYVARGSARKVELMAIDPQAQRTEAKGLKLALLEVRYVSVLIRQGNGTYRYESRRKESTLDEHDITIPASGAAIELKTGQPGTFALVVRDADGQVLSRVDFHVAGEANLTRSLDKNAELQIALSKKDYAPGEDIEMQITAPYTGSGLITIERDRVYSWKWFRTTATSSMQKIALPAGIEGNAYVSVAFVRDPGSSEIYTSPLSYGVQPFSVALDARRNAITLTAPERVKPGDTFTMRYRTDKPARIVVFAVDEGILQVARYASPDPLGFFFQKRMLNVGTQQILDLILPEFRALAGAAAPGGDAEGLLGKHLNPFKRKSDKPVAFWSGIVDADSTERELSYVVPDYFNGTLRVMAVAVADDSVGVHESRSQVRGDFVLSPNAPTTVAPGDEFEVSVGVSNNVEGSGADAQVTVTLAPTAHLEVVGPSQQTLRIPELHESSARFKLKVRDQLGGAELDFGAQLGTRSGHRRIGLSVRPATPYRTALAFGTVRKGEADVPVTRNLYPQFRTLQAGVSVLPLGLSHGLVSYLGHYPYSCTEQLMSQAMPAVVLADRPEFGYVKSLGGADLGSVIAELRSRQNDDGAYRLWPGGGEVAEFVSVYAQQFLLEASERGRAVPKDLIDAGNAHLQTLAARDGNNLDDERTTAYAIYLLTRQGNVMSSEASALQKRLEERYAKDWKKDIAAAYLASALQLMKQEGQAASMIRGVPFGSEHAYDRYHDAMTTDAELLYLLARHFPQRLADLPPAVMDSLVQRLQSGALHSLSAATTILALDAYAKAATTANPHLSIAEVLHDDGRDAGGRATPGAVAESKTLRALALPPGLLPKTEFSADASKLRFANDSDLNAYTLVEQSGFDRNVPTDALKNGFEIIHELTGADGKPVDHVKLGQELQVHLKFRAIGEPLYDVALVDLLPGGFELVVPPQDTTQALHQASEQPQPEGGDEGEGEGDEGEGAAAPAYEAWQCFFCSPGTNAALDYADLREDRAVFYASMDTSIHEIVYRVRATSAGSFVLPPAYGEAMYDTRKQARSMGGRIVVESP